MMCANDRVLVMRGGSPKFTYEVSGYPLGPMGVECQTPAFDPCTGGAGECREGTSFAFLSARGAMCVTYLAAFTLHCEPCA